MISREMLDRLRELAGGECYYDDENPNVVIDDYAGGNVDDAFYAGERAGEVMLARQVIADIVAEKLK